MAPPAEEGPRPYVSLTLGVFYYEFFGAGYGLTVGGHVLPRTVIEVDAYRAASLAPTQSSSTVALRLQQFADDKFYFRAGPRVRQLELTSLIDGNSALEERLLQTDVGLDIAGGIRLATGNFIFGVDFIGAYVPLASLSTEQQVYDDRAPSDEATGELLVADKQELRGRWDVRIGYLHLGTRF